MASSFWTLVGRADRSLAGIIIVATLLAWPGFASDKPIPIGGPDFAPYYERTEAGVGGTLTEMLTRILDNAGYKSTAEIFPAARLMENLVRGDTVSTLLVRNPTLDDSEAMLRSPIPVGELVLNLYSHREAVSVPSRDALRGKAIIVIRGYGYGTLRAWMNQPENAIALTEVNDHATALRLLSSGRVPHALLYDVNHTAGLKALGGSIEGVVTNPFQRVPFFIYLNKSAVADGPAMMRQLVAAYRDLVRKGAYPAMPGQERFLETGDPDS